MLRQPLLMEIANRIREGRAEADWSQRDLAARMRVTPSAVAQWELGQTMPSIANRADLSRLLNIPFIELVPEVAANSSLALKSPLVFAIVQQVLKLPPQVQEALLVQTAAMVEALSAREPSLAR